MSNTQSDVELAKYVDEAKSDAAHAFDFLKKSGTLSASLIFNIAHKIPDRDLLLSVSFPPPWSRNNEININLSKFSDHPNSVAIHFPNSP